MPDQLFLTALPNGKDGNSLRLSLLLTPSLAENNVLPPPWNTWPATAANLKWSVSFHTGAGHVPFGNPIGADRDPLSPPDFDANLWSQVFAGVLVKPRRGHRHLHQTWRLSHKIGQLHQDHMLYHLAHGYRQLAASRNIDLDAQFMSLRDVTMPPVLFLHPKFQSTVAQQYDERTNALGLLDAQVATIPVTYRDTVNNRIKHGRTQLEKYGGAPLSAVSLAALYITCLKAAGPAGIPVPAAVAAIGVIQNWFPPRGNMFPATCPDPMAPILDNVLNHVQMLLFHRRIPTEAPCKIDPPDFHQLLGLVHNYPAIMRPLGLVYDLVVTPPAGLTSPFSVAIHFGSDPYSTDVASQLSVTSPFTQCTMTADYFFATPEDDHLIDSGILNLQIQDADAASGQRFLLVSEDADGHGLKLTDQSNNSARADEYYSNAPTSMNQAPARNGMAATPPPSAAPTGPPPTPRTMGLALFDQGRLTALEKSAQKYVDSNGAPQVPTDLYAEDLILGYRVDVWYNGKFYSLCQRKSEYDIFKPRSNDQIGTWLPASMMELAADEGFISFGATQSVVDPMGETDPSNPNYSANSVTQIHQAVFTWTGWSLSVPPLKGFPTMNPPDDAAQQTSSDCMPENSKHLAIRPIFMLKDGAKQPPLRFNTDYAMRCRVVDLAGNSAPPTIDPQNTQYRNYTIQPATPFSLHEPIRAPHFLLLHPIDRESDSGSHIDRMVVRELDDVSERMLVPPRESLRLAELWGLLDSDRLPKTAFGAQQLLIDGSFPSVACAEEQGWIQGDVDTPADNDGIFLKNISGDDPKNPYYPDPLANYVRVEMFQLSDDPAQSKPVGSAVWIDMHKNLAWPQRLPVRIRMTPIEDGDPSATVDPDNLAGEPIGLSNVPTLDVKVPRAGTVVLKISSAYYDGSAPQPLDRKRFIQLSHLSRLPLNRSASIGAKAIGLAEPKLQRPARELATALEASLNSADPFLDGSLEISTPSRTMTLVHAVRQPLEKPEFATAASSGRFQVLRAPGRPEANVSGQLRAHWPSTSKLTCHAVWSDEVDDLNKKKHAPVHHREVAFVATAREFSQDTPWPASRPRTLNGVLENFQDTRAHVVTYSLVASSNFREYYPGSEDPSSVNEPEFQQAGAEPVKLTVLSSVRPLAPKLSYVIPAFLWTNTWDPVGKIWYAGRTIVLRAYFERPFLLSGDRETVGVVLFDAAGGDPSKQDYASRWGGDPARPVANPILQNELSELNLCQADHPLVTCALAEGGTARIKPCTIQYSEPRRLWYADIPINTQYANGPFVRLALVRWQPDSLSPDVLPTLPETRCSQVVFAEFMQVAPDRWVSVHKRSGSKYTITISGAFANDPANNPLSLTLQKRWYALGRDTGWRPAPCDVSFSFTPQDASGVSTWTAELDTKHSAYRTKYRVLLTEKEFPDPNSRKSLSMFVDLP
jgi:hypothetical protein